MGSFRRRLAAAALAAALIHGWLPGECRGAVVVIANRTPAPVSLAVEVDGAPPTTLPLAPGDSRPVFARTGVTVRIPNGGSTEEFRLQPNAAYYVGVDPTRPALVLQQIGLNESTPNAWPPARPLAESPDAGVITVKILADDDEVRLRRVWEAAIRKRIDEASAVLDEHCGIRLKVVAVDTWDSDDRQTDFHQSLAEFEREVLPAPAAVAIGFSSQFTIARGRIHLGGTRGPLHTHILIKERSRNVLDPERLELLVHELGHFLAASHSPEATSVMRPVLGQGLQRIAGARVQFDPPNTLLMALLGEEIRQRRVHELSAVSPQTRRRMSEIYRALDPTLPEDPAAGQFVKLVATAGVRPLIEDTRHVLQRITKIAEANSRAPQQVAGKSPAPLTGDSLLDAYVREAARAAQQVRRENAAPAFLLALGVALDDAGALMKLPIASRVIPHFEGERERAVRIAALGQPTMRGRGDLARHFFVSAHLVVLAGSETARGAGLVKELLDARGGSGFSFADMAANRAGIVFAHAVLSGRLSLDRVARGFSTEAFMPPVDDLREQMGAEEFIDAYGGPGDDRLAAELRGIELRIMAMPAYQQAAPAP
jgi:hypothetical protein